MAIFVLNPKGPEFKCSDTNQIYYNVLPILNMEITSIKNLKPVRKFPLPCTKKVV